VKQYADIAKVKELLQAASKFVEQVRQVAVQSNGFGKPEQRYVLLGRP
jgi:hypothetical protein